MLRGKKQLIGFWGDICSGTGEIQILPIGDTLMQIRISPTLTFVTRYQCYILGPWRKFALFDCFQLGMGT